MIILLVSSFVIISYLFTLVYLSRGYQLTFFDKTLFIIHALSLIITIIVTKNIIDDGLVVKFDYFINDLCNNNYPIFTKLIDSLSTVTDIKGILLITIIIMPIFYYKRCWSELAFYLISFTGGALIVLGIKNWIERFRPPNHPVDVSLLSFPSGHVALASILSLYLFFIFYLKMKKSLKKNLLLAGIIFITFSSALFRVCLHAHWFSDIFVAIAIEISWMTFLVLIFNILSSHPYKFKWIQKYLGQTLFRN